MAHVKRIKFRKSKRLELWEKAEKRCKHCEEAIDVKKTHIDHIIPLAAGRANVDSNLKILCKNVAWPKQKSNYWRTSM